ncbi:MAG: DegT/DnrJ/EryC1/StrS family aminotransferase [Candidatus Woesearchaeota archaeon]
MSATSDNQSGQDKGKLQKEQRENARAMLKVLTGKEHVHFTRRGNRAILIALRVIKQLEKSNILYQGEGGWLTYEPSIEKAELTPIKLVTNDGLIQPEELSIHDHDSALLINSMAGYAALHDMEHINSLCLANNQYLINDVSGSIGSEQAKHGDIILGSFGKSKPVDLETGGFIATSDEDIERLIRKEADEEPEINYAILARKLKDLDKRRQYLLSVAKQVKEDLSGHKIIHPDHEGLNVIVKFSDEDEKNTLIDYCKKKGLEYTECPREIRILDDAVSIEIKRLKGVGETEK